MKKALLGILCALFFFMASSAIRLTAQERQQPESADSEYGARFFEQLRTIFGTPSSMRIALWATGAGRAWRR
jgi:hypothetical protein